MGFIYACYVVKLISEEEDSCKYKVKLVHAHTHFTAGQKKKAIKK